MSRTTKVIANRNMRYGTRMLQAGDEFEAKARDARLLIAIGRAKPSAGTYSTKVTPPTPAVMAELQAKLQAPAEAPEDPQKTAADDGVEGSGDNQPPEPVEALNTPAPEPVAATSSPTVDPEAQKAELRRRYREKTGEAPDYRWSTTRLLRELGEA